MLYGLPARYLESSVTHHEFGDSTQVTQSIIRSFADRVVNSLLGKVDAGLREGVLVIGVSLFWALVLILAGFFWLGSGIFGGIETLIGSARRAAYPQIFAEKMTKEITQSVFSCAVTGAQQRLGFLICGRFQQSPNEEERPLIRPQ